MNTEPMNTESKPFKGHTDVVTGATCGIGRVIALEFARRGDDIAFHYQKSAEADKAFGPGIGALGVRAFVAQCGMTNVKAAAVMVKLRGRNPSATISTSRQ